MSDLNYSARCDSYMHALFPFGVYKPLVKLYSYIAITWSMVRLGITAYAAIS